MPSLVRSFPFNLPGASSLKSWHAWWSGYTYDSTLYNPGTSPAVTFSGAVPNQCGFGIKYTLGGALGTAKFQYSTDNGASYNGSDITTAASVGPLGSTGISLGMGSGTYVLDEIAKMVVGTWTGLGPSAHQLVQATASKKPEPRVTAKGRPLRFDGSNDILICSSGLANTLCSGEDTPCTIMCVAQHVAFSASGDDTIFCLGNSGASDNSILDVFRHFATTKWATNKHGTGGSFSTVDAASAAPDTNLHIFELVQYGTTVDLLVDGTAVISGATQDAPTAAFNVLSLGGTVFHGSENNLANCDVYELLTWTGARSSDERRAARQYLQVQYGI